MDYNKQANKFAKKHGVKLEIIGVEFKSMPWDKDGQKRNVYKLRLSRNNNEYVFEFGNSVNNSCALESKLNVLTENDKISMYSGFRSVGNKVISSGISYTLTKGELLSISDEKLLDLVESLKKDFYLSRDKTNKKWYDSFENGKISRDLRDSKLIGNVDEGMFINCIQRSIKSKIKELEEEQVFSKELQGDKQKDDLMYDVLSCLTKYCPDNFEDFCDEFGYDHDSRSAEKTFKGCLEESEAVQNLFGDIMEELLEIE